MSLVSVLCDGVNMSVCTYERERERESVCANPLAHIIFCYSRLHFPHIGYSLVSHYFD